MSTKILAHRGACAYAPENTMAAFQLAKELQADGFEIDVHLTKDGRLVVTHDETIERCSDAEGWIKDYTYEELKAVNFGAKFKGGNFQERLPLLSDVLELIRHTDMTLNIELKNSIVLYPELEEKTLAMIRDFNMEEQTVYSSFNHYSVVKMKALGTPSICGLLYTEPLFEPWKYAQMAKVEALHPHFANIQFPSYMENCRTAGLYVHTWTVNEEKDLTWMYKENVQAIITNFPDVARQVRKKIQGN